MFNVTDVYQALLPAPYFSEGAGGARLIRPCLLSVISRTEPAMWDHRIIGSCQILTHTLT